jgi:hypothetical protein
MHGEFGNAEDCGKIPGQTAKQMQDDGDAAGVDAGMGGQDGLPVLLAKFRVPALGDGHEVRLQTVIGDAMAEAKP